MTYMIEITESRVSEMSELAGKMLKYGSRLMECIDDLSKDDWQTSERRYASYDDYRSSGRRESDRRISDEDDRYEIGGRNGRPYRR